MNVTRDIDRIIEQVESRLPNVLVRKHTVRHPGVDDDGIWWFSLPNIEKDIQIESSNGTCPFIVEHDDMNSSAEAEVANTVDEAVEKIAAYLTTLVDRTG
ncbi:MAG: hypothetical protein DWQ42_12675 [Planctomycetota bacterium]|nr:MAG: hypothetical protein DWQ42_12675 [Planctomycetota bacterium]